MQNFNFESLTNVDYFYEFEILVLNFARNFIMCFDILLIYFFRNREGEQKGNVIRKHTFSN